MLTGRDVREARALLRLQRSELAARVKTVTTATIAHAETVDDEPPITVAQAAPIERTFKRAGVAFTPDGRSFERKILDAQDLAP